MYYGRDVGPKETPVGRCIFPFFKFGDDTADILHLWMLYESFCALGYFA